MKKAILLLLAALCTAATTLAYGFQSGDLYYNITSDTTVEVTYQEYRSSTNYQGLTTTTIPETVTYNGTTYSVTSIGKSAFMWCSSLTSVTIPSSVTSIEYEAFTYCSSLTSVTIPNSVTSIGDHAFYGCSSLTSVTIPNSVTSIGNYAFWGCSSLTSISIPNSVTSIGEWAFSSCSSLTSVTIPHSVTSIGECAFSYCSSLTSIVVESSNTMYDSRENCNAIIETASNTLIAGCQSTTIPNSVTSIGNEAFRGCSALTSVTIPTSVTSIGESAFRGCSSLTSVTIPNSVTSIGECAFSYCSSLTSIVVESSNTMYDSRENCNAIIETASNTLIAGCQSTTIPNSVTSIGDGAFQRCSSLTSIILPNSVTGIGEDAFQGCSSLTSVTIPNSVTSIGEDAFQACSSIADIYCYATTPPVCDDDNIFSGVSKRCNVHVPAGTIPNYQVATGWRYFSKFLEISEETAISETEQQNKSSRKIIRDGQVLILRNGVTYDMMGNTL